MYRHCLYCSADLGANDAVETFPVGRTLAFDAAKGRLWAVCPKCARWNLSPLEERWEAVEAAEKRFRDTALRAQSENVGVAKLPGGTRLIRVGSALPGELAAWRYGDQLVARWRRHRMALGAAVVVMGGVVGAKVVVAGSIIAGLGTLLGLGLQTAVQAGVTRAFSDDDAGGVVHRFRKGDLPGGDAFDLKSGHMKAAVLVPADGGAGFHLEVPFERSVVLPGPDGRRWVHRFDGYLLCGEDAPNALGRTLASFNVAGGSRRQVDAALALLSEARSADAFLRRAAEERRRVRAEGRAERPRALALEMALHDEQERRAMEGELALLEAAWREAEEIAAIADQLAAPALEPRTGSSG